ncbi:MAG TPA: hypothetical protein VF163_03590 [Micromonosporaceae bacterium]
MVGEPSPTPVAARPDASVGAVPYRYLLGPALIGASVAVLLFCMVTVVTMAIRRRQW